MDSTILEKSTPESLQNIEGPDWLRIGAFVQTLGWCGQITEIAVSEQKLYVRIFGAKSIYYGNANGDFVEFDPERIKPVSAEQAYTDVERYEKMEQQRLLEIQTLLAHWQSSI